jgi:uncharacterized protein (DUF2384 family)
MPPRPHPVPASPDKRALVLSKATARAADNLGLSNTVLARVLGLSDSTISRLKTGAYVLEPESKAYELAQLFVRLFRGLSAITGGDDEAARSWLRGPNTALRARPIDRIVAIPGLFETVAYVDSRRARV